jgi:hypothetical protein
MLVDDQSWLFDVYAPQRNKQPRREAKRVMGQEMNCIQTYET